MHIVDPLNNSSQVEQSELDAALVRAVEEGDVDGVKLLLEKQANPNLKGEAGWSPMTHAAYEGSAAVFNELLNYGGDVSTYDDGNQTPFYWAAARGNIDICRRILELGSVDINHQGNNGISPTMAAAEQGKIDVLKLLINHGADLTLLRRNANGSAANTCSFAESRNHKDIVDLIVETIGLEAAYKYKAYKANNGSHVDDAEIPYVRFDGGEFVRLYYEGRNTVVMVSNAPAVFNNVEIEVSIGVTNQVDPIKMDFIQIRKEHNPIKLGNFSQYCTNNEEIIDFIKRNAPNSNELEIVKMAEYLKNNNLELNDASFGEYAKQYDTFESAPVVLNKEFYADVKFPYVLANAGEYLSITYKGNQLVVMVENISYVFNNLDCQISVGKTNTSSFNLLSLIPVLKEYQPIELGSYDNYYQKNAEIVDFIKGFDSGNRLNEFDVVKLSECMKRNEYELNKTDLMLAYKKFQENDLI